MAAALTFPLVKLLNRVLRDYPRARAELAAHAGKVVAIDIDPFAGRFRIDADGSTEMFGEGFDAPPALVFQISPALLPRLMRRDETAYREIVFTGDSELASLLSNIARNVEWDIEEDLSKLIGDIAAHRVIDGLRGAVQWRDDAGERLTANIAEYLTEEKRAFIVAAELELLARANETLRDDVARLDARFNRLTAGQAAK